MTTSVVVPAVENAVVKAIHEVENAIERDLRRNVVAKLEEAAGAAVARAAVEEKSGVVVNHNVGKYADHVGRGHRKRSDEKKSVNRLDENRNARQEKVRASLKMKVSVTFHLIDWPFSLTNNVESGSI